MRRKVPASLLVALWSLCLVSAPAGASGDGGNQLKDNLSSYTGLNAQGYLGPLRDALGSALNSGLFMRGVPKEGLHFRLDARGMLVNFGDSDRVFQARTESYFGSETTVTAPTVVGSERSVQYTDPETGGTFTFPGGLNLDRFGLAVPQLTVGSFYGTEFLGRYIAFNTGDSEIGDIKLYGFGARHSISSHLPDSPVDISVFGFWQKLRIGSDFIESKALTLGGTVGKTFGLVDVYGGLSYDSINLDVSYESHLSSQPETINVSLDRKSTGHLTAGATLGLGFFNLNGEFNLANQSSLAFGVGLGM